jgi:hypothetical protein
MKNLFDPLFLNTITCLLLTGNAWITAIILRKYLRGSYKKEIENYKELLKIAAELIREQQTAIANLSMERDYFKNMK